MPGPVQGLIPTLTLILLGSLASYTFTLQPCHHRPPSRLILTHHPHPPPSPQGIRQAEAVGEKVVEGAEVAVEEGAGVCAMLCGLCQASGFLEKIEIVRDFYQVIALFFTYTLPKAFHAGFAWLSGLSAVVAIEFDFAFSISTKTWHVILAIIGFLCLALTGYILATNASLLAGTEDKGRQGHEHRSWKEKNEESARKVTVFKYMFMGIVTLYLPLSQFALETITCFFKYGVSVDDGDDKYDGFSNSPTPEPTSYEDMDAAGSQCFNDPDNGFGPGDVTLFWVTFSGSFIILLLITIAVPIQTYMIIAKNKPVGSLEDPTHRFDDDGNLVEYTDAMYRLDLLTDEQKINPFQWLYKDYERDHAHYKVVENTSHARTPSHGRTHVRAVVQTRI